MLKKTITYTDYNGNTRTEDFYFNFNRAEIAEMEMSVNGGMRQMIERVISAQDTKTLIGIFKELILKAYGEKDLDGKKFVKSEALSTAFSQTEAYSILFMELANDAKAAAEFFNAVIPQQDAAK